VARMLQTSACPLFCPFRPCISFPRSFPPCDGGHSCLRNSPGHEALSPLYDRGVLQHLPPGLIGGDAIRAYYLTRMPKKISATLASVFMDRYIGFVSLMLIGIVAYPFSLGSFFRISL